LLPKLCRETGRKRCSPASVNGSFRPEYDALRWSDNREYFQAWCAGVTGYPIVDAAMRCLNTMGWIHNRLLLSWQWGERYFMQKMVDGDLAANNGGWQWCAGTGTDAAPHFRIFNPVSQSEKRDPEGKFIRRWLPELATLPVPVIHQPWKDTGALIGSKYPRRIVLHEEQRSKCIAMFQRVNQRTRGA
jgi:deoxyribodipyrimidine photo-lyase